MFYKILLFVTISLILQNCESLIACLPNYCTNAKCPPVENCDGSNHVIKPGGFCGCCNKCYTLLKENDTCDSLIIMGSPPPLYECGYGLDCCKGICKQQKECSQ